MEVPTRRPNIDIRMPSSNDGNIFKHVHDLIHTLSTSDEGQLKEILRDLTLQCASSIGVLNEKSSNWSGYNNLAYALLGLVQSEEKAIMEAGTRELCQLLEQVNDIIQGNNQVGIILGWVLDSLSAKRPLNKSSEEQVWKNKICAAIKVASSAMKGGYQTEILISIQEAIYEFSENDDEDIDIVTACSAFNAVWKKMKFNNIKQQQIKQLTKDNQRLKCELQIINKSSIWQLMAKVLSLKLEGNEVEQQKIIQKQEDICNLINEKFEKNNKEIHQKLIDCGVTDALLNILKNRDLNLITFPFIFTFGLPVSSSKSKNFNKYCNNLQPFPALLRLLDHSETTVIGSCLVSISNLLITAGTSIISQPNRYFETMLQCDGINKIFALFQRTEQEDIKNSAAVIIGRLYKTREIENQQMRTEIIEYLKTIVGNADEWNNNESRKALKGLAQNAVNRTVIEAGGFIIPERNEN